MELVSFDDNTVTIKLNRKTEFTALSNIVSAAAIDSDRLDREITELTPEDVSKLENAIRTVRERMYGVA